jgi:hypothetical protein
MANPQPDHNIQAIQKLVALIERFRDSARIQTKGGAQIHDLLVRAKENLRIGCVDDAIGFLTQVRGLIAGGWPAAGELARDKAS